MKQIWKSEKKHGYKMLMKRKLKSVMNLSLKPINNILKLQKENIKVDYKTLKSVIKHLTQ